MGHIEGTQNPIVSLSSSVANGAWNYAKSMFTWKGRDITHLQDDQFLESNNWKNNLELLSELTVVSPVSSLMTKEIYQWLPEHSPLSEGYSNVQEKFEEMSSDAFLRWLNIGAAMGITYVFVKAMQENYNCLDQYEVVTDDVMRECRIHYGETFGQAGSVAKFVVSAGTWAFVGWLIKNLGDYGLKGTASQEYYKHNLVNIYKTTADSAREAFWGAVDAGDEESIAKIQAQTKKIKALLPYMKECLSKELNFDKERFKKIMRPFDVLVEDVQNYEKQKKAAEAVVEEEKAKEQQEAPGVEVTAPPAGIDESKYPMVEAPKPVETPKITAPPNPTSSPYKKALTVLIYVLIFAALMKK